MWYINMINEKGIRKEVRISWIYNVIFIHYKPRIAVAILDL